MRPIYAGARIAGTAVTVLLQPGDNWMLHVAVEQLKPGDIIVVAADHVPRRRLLRRPARHLRHGARRRGLVIDAGVRDVTS